MDTDKIPPSCMAWLWSSIQTCRSISEISISPRDVQRVAVRVTIDLREMVFVLIKGDPGIAALYDKLLVSSDLWSFWEQLRAEGTKELLLLVLLY